MRPPRPAVLLVALAGVAVVLSGCAVAGGGPAPSGSSTTNAVSGSLPDALDRVPTSCAALALTDDARIEGRDLALCLTDFRRAVVTGRSDITFGGGAATLVWHDGDDGLYTVQTGPSDGRIATSPDDGWIESDGAWVHADAGGTSEEQFTAAGIAAYRTQTSPEFTVVTIGAASAYVVAGRTEVQVANGDRRTLWQLDADAPFSPFEGNTVTELHLYVDDQGVLQREDLTSTFQGLEGSSTTLFSEWGAKVDLSAVEQLAGVQLG